MKNLNAAPGPYEVVTIIDEEGKARGRNGEQWLLIRNADGAIASVYPGQDAEGTARLLGACWNLLDACKLARAVAQDEVDRLSDIADADRALEEAKSRLCTFEHAIFLAGAEGRRLSSVPTPPGAPDSGEANTKSIFPEKPLEDTLL